MRKTVLLLTLVLTLSFTLSGSAVAAPTVLVDGRQLFFEVPPVIEQGRVMVPIRGIAEALGADVGWESSTKTLELSQGDTTIKLQIGNTQALKNNQRLMLDTVPRIVQNRTLVPLRFISEAFGASVSWDGAAQEVSISRVSGEKPEDSLERQIFELTNSARAEYGLEPFKWDRRLAEVARQHSQDMRDQGFFSHNSPDGDTPL